MKIWTECYSPVIMGGDVNAPIITEIDEGEYTGPYDVGKDIQVYLVPNPQGNKQYVVESTTGAIVGMDIEQVRSDVAQGDPEVMKKQLVAAAERVKKARPEEKSAFWSKFRD